MLTQDPTLRAKALLKGATKPVTIYLGYYHKTNALAAVDSSHLLKKSLPNTTITVAPDTAIETLAQALQDQWERLHGEHTKGKATPDSTPDRRHVWRRRDIARAMR